MVFELLGRTLHIDSDVWKFDWSYVHVIYPQGGDVGDVVGGEVAVTLTVAVVLLGPVLGLPGHQPPLLPGAGDGVVQEEAEHAAHEHARLEQDLDDLVQLGHTGGFGGTSQLDVMVLLHPLGQDQ